MSPYTKHRIDNFKKMRDKLYFKVALSLMWNLKSIPHFKKTRKMKELLLLFLGFNLSILSSYAQSLEKEFVTFTRDEKALRYNANLKSLDSLLSAKKLSHPTVTVRLVKKMMNNEAYCDKYKKESCISLKEDEVFDCLLCQEKTDIDDLRKRYPNLFKDEKYKKKVSRYLWL